MLTTIILEGVVRDHTKNLEHPLSRRDLLMDTKHVSKPKHKINNTNTLFQPMDV